MCRRAGGRPGLGAEVARATLRATGKITPPPRAVSEGMNGASTTSAAASEYPRRQRTARESPDEQVADALAEARSTVKARANRNAMKISQTVTLLKPESTFAGGSVPVSASSVIAITTLTPIGTGCATSATIVATNMPSRWLCTRVQSGKREEVKQRAGNEDYRPSVPFTGGVTSTFDGC